MVERHEREPGCIRGGVRRVFLILVLALAGLVSAACEDDVTAEESGYFFVGRVYDGATGERLIRYTVELIYADQQVAGTVAANGRYYLGPLEALHDYTIEVNADGYRSFLSHNAMIQTIDDSRSYYYDAYLFPYDLPTPKTDFYITLIDTEARPSGLYRMRPTAASSLYDDEEQRPAGVVDGDLGVQRWENDEDLQFQTLFGSFQDGQFSLVAGELVYGVPYEVVIYGVNGYQEFRQPFTAGIDGQQAYELSPLNETPLEVSFVSTELGVRLEEAKVVVVVNQPVELDPLDNFFDVIGAVNAGFSIVTADDDADGEVNTLRVGDRGVTLTINEKRIVLEWDRSIGLEVSDPNDDIRQATFSSLASIRLRPVGGNAATSTALSTLLGDSNSLSVDLIYY